MKKLGYFLLLLPLLFAFGKNRKPQHSKYLTKHYVKVPAGKVYMNEQGDTHLLTQANELGLDSIAKSKYIRGLDSCLEFYMASTEVTNIQWREFLMYLKQEGETEEYKANILDTTVWRQGLGDTEPFVNYYYQHQAYSEYPAVGMTLKQAKAYAHWLTEIYSLKNQGVKITFSVPTKKQWIRAARGDETMRYPWGGPYLRNSKGLYLANFKSYDASTIHYNDESKKYEIITPDGFIDDAIITAPGKSYFPNQFGVYNMSGNVAELVSDDAVAMGGSWNDTGYDVRVESEQPAAEPKSTIGFRVIAVIE